MRKQDSLLSRIEIANPCHADWESMTGDERQRACQLCNLNVYNISTMTKGEAESFLRERMPQGRACVRLFRRRDGTIITDNCPLGLRAARDAARRIKHRVAAAASLLLAFLPGLPGLSQNTGTNKTMGKVRMAPGKPSYPQITTGAPTINADAPARMVMMGDVVVTNPSMVKYVIRMKEKIKHVWQKPIEYSDRIKVLFEIDRNGTISHLKIATSSGQEHLDKKALQAVKQAAPFESVPTLIETPFQAEYIF
jgi:TonB family protein